jgi:hypothetical protein
MGTEDVYDGLSGTGPRSNPIDQTCDGTANQRPEVTYETAEPVSATLKTKVAHSDITETFRIGPRRALLTQKDTSSKKPWPAGNSWQANLNRCSAYYGPYGCCGTHFRLQCDANQAIWFYGTDTNETIGQIGIVRQGHNPFSNTAWLDDDAAARPQCSNATKNRHLGHAAQEQDDVYVGSSFEMFKVAVYRSRVLLGLPENGASSAKTARLLPLVPVKDLDTTDSISAKYGWLIHNTSSYKMVWSLCSKWPHFSSYFWPGADDGSSVNLTFLHDRPVKQRNWMKYTIKYCFTSKLVHGACLVTAFPVDFSPFGNPLDFISSGFVFFV